MGSPLIIEGQLIGILSFSLNTIKMPVLYTKISDYETYVTQMADYFEQKSISTHDSAVHPTF